MVALGEIPRVNAWRKVVQMKIRIERVSAAPSTCTNTAGAMDYDLRIRLDVGVALPVGVTLHPHRQYAGGMMQVWGQIDNWLSEGGIAIIDRLKLAGDDRAAYLGATVACCTDGEDQLVELDLDGDPS